MPNAQLCHTRGTPQPARSHRRRSGALLLTFLLSIGFIGCSDSDSLTDLDPGAGTTATGFFIDAAVQGLTYQSGDNLPGVTDETGAFEYTPGEPLTFSIGGVELGTLSDGAPVCTPFDFVVPENIARFIQSLDIDNDPSNGIDVTVAAAILAGQSVSSAVFENTDAAAFESDPAIIGAIAAVPGAALVDANTANENLNNGTDNTFDVAELAGVAFVLVISNEGAAGIVVFDELSSPGAQGSTGFSVDSEEIPGTGSEFSWNVDAAGVLSVIDEDGGVTTLTRAGGTARSISAIGIFTDTDGTVEPPELLTLLRPVDLTETDIAGAPTTTGGTSTLAYTIAGNGESVQLTFKSDGTVAGIDDIGSFVGTWSVNEIAQNVIQFIDGSDPDLVPNEWAFIFLLNGSPATGGDVFVVDVTFTGNDTLSGEPDLTFDEFSFRTLNRQ